MTNQEQPDTRPREAFLKAFRRYYRGPLRVGTSQKVTR